DGDVIDLGEHAARVPAPAVGTAGPRRGGHRPAVRRSPRPTIRGTSALEEPMPGSVIVSSARTPIGKLSGSLASFTAPELGGHAIAAALARAGITGDQVDHVILGMVLQAGGGQVPARQAAAKGGV